MIFIYFHSLIRVIPRSIQWRPLSIRSCILLMGFRNTWLITESASFFLQNFFNLSFIIFASFYLIHLIMISVIAVLIIIFIILWSNLIFRFFTSTSFKLLMFKILILIIIHFGLMIRFCYGSFRLLNIFHFCLIN